MIERLQYEQALKEADRRKDEFLATLAHELRNPLAAVANAVRVAALPDVPADAAGRALGIIERQTGQLTRLIDDLLDVSRISHGKVRLRKQACDLGAFAYLLKPIEDEKLQETMKGAYQSCMERIQAAWMDAKAKSEAC